MAGSLGAVLKQLFWDIHLQNKKDHICNGSGGQGWGCTACRPWIRHSTPSRVFQFVIYGTNSRDFALNEMMLIR